MADESPFTGQLRVHECAWPNYARCAVILTITETASDNLAQIGLTIEGLNAVLLKLRGIRDAIGDD